MTSICSNSGAKALRSTLGTLDTNEGGRTEGTFQKAWNPQCFWKEPHMRLIQTENFLLGAQRPKDSLWALMWR